jgi:hypothetical protein
MMNQNVKLPIQEEVTSFFEENPFAYETIAGLSLRLGRNVTDLESGLNKLVSLAILKKMGDGARAIYCYNHLNVKEAESYGNLRL